MAFSSLPQCPMDVGAGKCAVAGAQQTHISAMKLPEVAWAAEAWRQALGVSHELLKVWSFVGSHTLQSPLLLHTALIIAVHSNQSVLMLKKRRRKTND